MYGLLGLGADTVGPQLADGNNVDKEEGRVKTVSIFISSRPSEKEIRIVFGQRGLRDIWRWETPAGNGCFFSSVLLLYLQPTVFVGWTGSVHV